MQSKFWPVYSIIATGFLVLFSLNTGSIRAQQARLMQEKQYLVEKLNSSMAEIEKYEQREEGEKNSIREKIIRLNPMLNPAVLADSVDAVFDASKEFSVDQDLIIAVAHEESNFDPKAVSPHGAMGLMQIMPLWQSEIDFIQSPNDLLDIKKNIRAGAYILKQYSKMFHGNRRMALLAYNRGPGTVLSLLHAGENPDNGYPSVVLASYERVQR